MQISVAIVAGKHFTFFFFLIFITVTDCVEEPRRGWNGSKLLGLFPFLAFSVLGLNFQVLLRQILSIVCEVPSHLLLGKRLLPNEIFFLNGELQWNMYLEGEK